MIPDNVLEFLKTIARNHRGCDDGWYACPLSKDYISHTERDEQEIRKCDCWAEPAKKILEEL